MIPGSVSKMSDNLVASAATIAPFSEVVRVTGAVQIDNIVPPLGNGFSQFMILIPVSGALVLGTAGNILVGITAVQNRAVMLIWSKAIQKWFIGSGV